MCGISAFISNKNQNINFLKFKLISVYNDGRGGHGTGIWANTKDTQFLKKKSSSKDFTNFFIDNPLISNPEATCIIGHTRYATKGLRNDENLHPFKLSEDFIFCHNGTIYNIDTLLKKYPLENIDSLKDVDSEILGKLILKYGSEVLKEYTGKAALVWTDNGGKSLKIFKGASKNKLSNFIEERPLYLYKSEEGFYFSSTNDGPLVLTLKDEKDSIIDLEVNTIFEFMDNSIISTEEIDRSLQFNEEPITSFMFCNSNNNGKFTSVSSKIGLKVSVESSQIYYLDGMFLNKKNKPLNGQFVYNKKNNSLNYINKPNDNNLEKENYFLFYEGYLVDLNLAKKKLSERKLELNCKNILELKIGLSNMETISYYPVLYNNSSYWYKEALNNTIITLPIFLNNIKIKFTSSKECKILNDSETNIEKEKPSKDSLYLINFFCDYSQIDSSLMYLLLSNTTPINKYKLIKESAQLTFWFIALIEVIVGQSLKEEYVMTPKLWNLFLENIVDEKNISGSLLFFLENYFDENFNWGQESSARTKDPFNNDLNDYIYGYH